MNLFNSNLKTTLTGIAALMVAGGHIMSTLPTGNTANIGVDITSILTAIGLIFASDAQKK